MDQPDPSHVGEPVKTKMDPNQSAIASRNRQLRANLSSKDRVFLYLSQHWDSIKSFASMTEADQAKMLELVEQRKLNLVEDPVPLVRPQPSEILATLRDYQLFGFNWLANLYEIGSGGGILADEMGLGKTLQTISLLSYLRFDAGVEGPYLVLAPLSVLPAWIKELGNWCPKLKVLKFHGQSAQRETLREEIMNPDLDVIVTSYEMAISETDTLSHMSWKCLVLDEGHKIKNNKTNTYKFISSLQAHFKLVLTGTPIQNNTRELWALLSFLYPQVFRLPDEFTLIDDQTKQDKLDADLLTSLHKLIQLVMLRRLKTDVALDLPPKVETKIYLPLTGVQVTWYKKLLTENPEKLKDKANLMKLIMNLRKCVNHPYLIQPINPGETVKEEGGEHLVSCSTKLCFIDKLLPKLKAQQSQVLIYSQFLGVLDILEEYCQFRGHKYVRLDGGVHPTKRNVIINAFTHKDSDIFVFLLSTRSGGLGINLMTANTVIIHDSDWNPQMDVQAMARAHRIGQKSSVNIYRLLTKDTIEERILAAATQKLYLEAVVVRKDEGTTKKSKKSAAAAPVEEKSEKKLLEEENDEEQKTLSKLLPKDLLKLVTFGANQIFKADSEADITNLDLDAFLQKSQEHQNNIANGGAVQECGEGEYNASSFQSWVKLASSYKFQGKDYEKIVRNKSKTNAAESETWVDLGKRKRSSKFILVDGELVHAPSVPGAEEIEDPSLKHAPKKKKLKNWTQDDICDCCKHTVLVGDKIACQRCPKVFHLDCIALRVRPKRWACPWHCCCKCGNSSSTSGGILCQCETCMNSFCETCFFDETKEHFMEYVNNSLFEEKFDYHKQQTIYIRCRFCLAKKKKLQKKDNMTIETTTGNDPMQIESGTKKEQPDNHFQLNPYYPKVGKRVLITEKNEKVLRGTIFRYSPESNEYCILFDNLGTETWLEENPATWKFVDRAEERVIMKTEDDAEAEAEAKAQAEMEAEAQARAEARAVAKAEREAQARAKQEEKAAQRAKQQAEQKAAQQARAAAQAQAAAQQAAQQQAIRLQQQQQAAQRQQWGIPSYYGGYGHPAHMSMQGRSAPMAYSPQMGHPSFMDLTRGPMYSPMMSMYPGGSQGISIRPSQDGQSGPSHHTTPNPASLSQPGLTNPALHHAPSASSLTGFPSHGSLYSNHANMGMFSSSIQNGQHPSTMHSHHPTHSSSLPPMQHPSQNPLQSNPHHQMLNDQGEK